MNLSHFTDRAKQSGHLQEENISEQEFRNLLERRIDALDVAAAVSDVTRFVKDMEALKIWSRDYFMELAQRVSIKAS
jgi:hypothetical protein